MQIQPVAMGLLNIAMAYHADDEEEDLQLVDNNLHLNVAEQAISEGQEVGSEPAQHAYEVAPLLKEGGETSIENHDIQLQQIQTNEGADHAPIEQVFANAISIAAEGTHTSIPQPLSASYKGKEDVPIPQGGTSSNFNNKGNFGIN